jgi:rod shape-determining protein MreD
LGLAFCLGVAADLFDGVLLGEQALRLTAMVFIALRFRSRLRFFPMWQQSLAVLGLLVNDRILLMLVRVFSGDPLPPPEYWISPLVGAALWPFLFLILDDLRARLRIHEA